LSMMFGSRFAMCLGWGPDLLLFYNDAYLPVLGVKEPTALGRPLAEVWYELWEGVRAMAESAMSGTATWVEDMYLRLERKGVTCAWSARAWPRTPGGPSPTARCARPTARSWRCSPSPTRPPAGS